MLYLTTEQSSALSKIVGAINAAHYEKKSKKSMGLEVDDSIPYVTMIKDDALTFVPNPSFVFESGVFDMPELSLNGNAALEALSLLVIGQAPNNHLAQSIKGKK